MRTRPKKRGFVFPKNRRGPPVSTSRYNFGFRPAMGRLLASHDGIGPAFSALFAQIMFEPGFLNGREREMVAAVAASAQDCHY